MLNQILDRIGLSRAVNEDWLHDAPQEIKEKYREITSEVFRNFGTADVWLLRHPLFRARILVGIVLNGKIGNKKYQMENLIHQSIKVLRKIAKAENAKDLQIELILYSPIIHGHTAYIYASIYL